MQSVGKTVVSTDWGKGGEEEDDDDDLKRAAAHSRKLARKIEILEAVENVSEIRESATRVKTWFRALGVELNENVLVSVRDDDENEMDTFARALTKAATDGSLLKEIVESESSAQIPSSVFVASSSITEGVLKHLRTSPELNHAFCGAKTKSKPALTSKQQLVCSMISERAVDGTRKNV